MGKRGRERERESKEGWWNRLGVSGPEGEGLKGQRLSHELPERRNYYAPALLNTSLAAKVKDIMHNK